MKKLITLLVLSMCVVAAQAKTFLDKTNTDQLNYRVLDPGQISWNEEDDSAILYIGSPSEVKNLHVADPTAIRGYRSKDITDELTINASANMTSELSNTVKWVSSAQDVYHYEYIDLEHKQGGVKYNGTTWDNADPWVTGIYVHNSDDTYTPVSIPVGTWISGTNCDENVQYAYQRKYVLLTAEVISRSVPIEYLDYVYEESQPAGLTDMQPIQTERSVTYNGRRATVEVKVTHTSGYGKYVKLSGFSAKCLGIGDAPRANDLKVNKVLIYDSITDEKGRGSGNSRRKKKTGKNKASDPSDTASYDGAESSIAGAFDLYNLRSFLIHYYDGNRGQHWANYPATNNVKMTGKYLMWGSQANNTYSMGRSGDAFTFNFNGITWFKYQTAGTNSLAGTPYEGVQIAITDIHQETSGEDEGCWTLDIALDVPAGKQTIPLNMMEVHYATSLTEPILWTPIVCRWDPIDANGLEYHIVIPQVYAEPTMGFWRIFADANPLENKLFIKAEVQVIGSDGYKYKLTFPTGGGAVTAVLVD